METKTGNENYEDVSNDVGQVIDPSIEPLNISVGTFRILDVVLIIVVTEDDHYYITSTTFVCDYHHQISTTIEGECKSINNHNIIRHPIQ